MPLIAARWIRIIYVQWSIHGATRSQLHSIFTSWFICRCNCHRGAPFSTPGGVAHTFDTPRSRPRAHRAFDPHEFSVRSAEARGELPYTMFNLDLFSWLPFKFPISVSINIGLSNYFSNVNICRFFLISLLVFDALIILYLTLIVITVKQVLSACISFKI